MIFSFWATSSTQFVSAKSTYASSTNSGQGNRSASSRMRSGGSTVPDGLLGFGRKTSFNRGRGATKSSPSDQSAWKRDLFGLGPLHLGQRLVEDVARIGQPQAIALADERPRDDRQNIVAAVAAQNPIRLDAEHLGGPAAKCLGQRIGIALQAALEHGGNRPANRRRAGIGIFVGVELDELLAPRGCSPGT